MTWLVFDKKHRAALANMAMLYAGKTSGVLVAVVFLPLYSRVLGAEQFGMVAVILSLQALLVMVDLGMSTLVSRDIAAAEISPAKLLKLIRTAEISLSGFYLFLFVATAAFKAFGGLNDLDFGTALGAVILFWVLVLQNLYYLAMLSRRAYATASTIQFVGVVIRAVATAYVLANISASLTAFVTTQLVLGVIHSWVTRRYCSSMFQPSSSLNLDVDRPKIVDSISLLKRGRSLALFTAAGAAVMQLDKPIVYVFMAASSVTPYFLATSLCMVPLSILAGPISQYFQPLLLNAVSRQDAGQAHHTIKRFVGALLLVTGFPSICLWLLRAPIIDMWMGQNPSNTVIAHYVGILLPGVALGALGFIPYALLLSARDFRFQAILFALLTIITLVGVTVSAFYHSVEGVCYIYAIYHVISTLLSWLRAIRLSSTREMAKFSFAFAMKSIIMLISIALVTNYIFH